MVGAERPQLTTEGIVELGKAVQKDDEWPRARVGVVQLDSVHGRGRVVNVGVVGMHERLDASDLDASTRARPTAALGSCPRPELLKPVC